MEATRGHWGHQTGDPRNASDRPLHRRRYAPATRKHAIWNPSTGEVQAEVALGDAALLARAVETAKRVQPAWAATNPQRRARVMFAFKELVEANMQSLAEMLSSEHGKTVPDAKGDVQRGLEVIEYACGLPQIMKGEYTHGAGPGIDVYSVRQPLGIGAGITPFNFPAMIPMWMFGMACAAGNAFILKPSERDPSVPVRLAELFLEAGAPEGLLQVVHGDKEMVDAIIDHPDIAAISFVGSSGHRAIYLRARLGQQQARAGLWRGEEPRDRAARCGLGSGRHRLDRRGLRLGGRTLHGAARGGTGGRGNR